MLGALFSLFPAAYIAMGVAFITGQLDGRSGRGPPPAFGWIFAMGASSVILVVLAGRFIARRRHWTYCIVVAAVSCAFFPFGTVLGVFTILVLSREEVKAHFAALAGPRPPPSASP